MTFNKFLNLSEPQKSNGKIEERFIRYRIFMRVQQGVVNKALGPGPGTEWIPAESLCVPGVALQV